MAEAIDYIEPEQAHAVIDRLGFQVRDEGLLQSALARASAGMFGQDAYETLELKAAAMFSSLAQNHSLFDGNKRLSLYLTFAFLRINGYRVTFTNDEAFDLVLDVAQSKIDLDRIAELIRDHLGPRVAD
ncbi:type II toxin-antitoxin system death-on-curing family toxin [Microbacterium rhizomatis]|uniref:Type II toxin-antitoxin system death-on-curing family toxin n=1 Tax=Microbacterium rhizomatis TaxID=1631477 RepID=A0A5J5J1L3_9MICO|nr:type II toxin-antitoxin system death-on-curing family toxin [Microbacterium rhizomatis]KAA9108426.1 type II toxin-antitoxin system death-on-curing family toxin [Microbacterium rhizomatis]